MREIQWSGKFWMLKDVVNVFDAVGINVWITATSKPGRNRMYIRRDNSEYGWWLSMCGVHVEIQRGCSERVLRAEEKSHSNSQFSWSAGTFSVNKRYAWEVNVPGWVLPHLNVLGRLKGPRRKQMSNAKAQSLLISKAEGKWNGHIEQKEKQTD